MLFFEPLMKCAPLQSVQPVSATPSRVSSVLDVQFPSDATILQCANLEALLSESPPFEWNTSARPFVPFGSTGHHIDRPINNAAAAPATQSDAFEVDFDSFRFQLDASDISDTPVRPLASTAALDLHLDHLRDHAAAVVGITSGIAECLERVAAILQATVIVPFSDIGSPGINNCSSDDVIGDANPGSVWLYGADTLDIQLAVNYGHYTSTEHSAGELICSIRYGFISFRYLIQAFCSAPGFTFCGILCNVILGTHTLSRRPNAF